MNKLTPFILLAVTALSLVSALSFSFGKNEKTPNTTSTRLTQTPLGHVELGGVRWLRDFDEAQALSKNSGKPMLVLFQEVPGCAGCQQYGQDVLQHPLLIEAIEDLFVPLAIYNNRKGTDAEILKRYNEPAWNYQVIRYLDEKGKDLIPRKDRIWTIEGTAQRMIQALQKHKKAVPQYLSLLAEESNASHLKTAAFAMYCFWEGEAQLGKLDGVVTTEAGWMEGKEVVKLTYDPKKVAWDTLVNHASKHDCAHKIFAPDSTAIKQTKNPQQHPLGVYRENKYRPAKQSDQKRMIQDPRLKNLQLTPAQATKVNAALRSRDMKALAQWLSPRQIAALRKEVAE